MSVRNAYGKMSFSGGEPVLQDKSITSNGTYTADEGYDGIGTATVNVPNPSTGTVSITSNGTTDVTDYASASVNVQPTLQDKTITANGTYSADSGYDGLDEVTVNVPNPSSGSLSISANGTYDVTEKASAVVNVPQPSGTINVTNMQPTDVTNYATAQVVDADLVAGNIKKDVDILGVVGTYEGGGATEPYTEEVYDSSGNLTSAILYGYTKVRPYLFYMCQNLTQVSLSSGITNIEGSAFHMCQNLTQISLPSGITSIGSAAFWECSNLALTSLPSGITSIGNNAFGRCSNLALTSLPSGITSIGDNTFTDCTNLALTSLPSGVASIGKYAFEGCSKLAWTSLPSGIVSIPRSAFDSCTLLALTSLPSGITKIDQDAFKNCTSLALTSLPSGIASIGFNSFYRCLGLTSVTFEGTPTKIDSTTFNGCTNLTEIKVPWAEGAVANAPWGATNATITYNYTA